MNYYYKYQKNIICVDAEKDILVVHRESVMVRADNGRNM